MEPPITKDAPASGSPSNSATLPPDDVAAIDELRTVFDQLCGELGRVVVGQHEVMEEMVICLLAGGHALLMGVPGLAKTLLVKRLAETMSLAFSRIQFTPDLMPMDITGTDILQERRGLKREFEFVKAVYLVKVACVYTKTKNNDLAQSISLRDSTFFFTFPLNRQHN